MGLNATNLVLQIKGDKSIASGFDHAIRTDDNTFSIYFIDGSNVDLTIPVPKDGKDGIDVIGVHDFGNSKFTLLLSDGTETSSIQTVNGQKGESGVSPTITENVDNTDKIYKLDIETADRKFTTPNLRGKDGTGGECVSNWSEISDKPFETLSTDFSVVDGILKVVGSTGGNDTFIGTMDEYNTAVSEGKIKSGTLVVITTEN